MITIILGTRPEIIKMSSVIRACERKAVDFRILHTGQHYSYSMDQVFFKELELPEAHHNLDVGSGTHAEQIGMIMIGVENVLLKEQPSAVLVEGDTNTVLAGAMAASKLGIKVGHVEAGLRSFDRRMPEEVNRVLTDHISDYLYVPTDIAKGNLEREGIVKGVVKTGNTIVDAVFQNRLLAEKKSRIMRTHSLMKAKYVLVTAHRQENVDDRERLNGMLDGLRIVGRETGLRVIFPVHPRTRNSIGKFMLSTKGLELLDPVGYLDFLMLESNAKLILTDSGGVQEEACILRVPCVTMRDNTERPETVQVGANLLAGTKPNKILSRSMKMLDVPRTWKNPFGNGKTGERIVDHLIKALDLDRTPRHAKVYHH